MKLNKEDIKEGSIYKSNIVFGYFKKIGDKIYRIDNPLVGWKEFNSSKKLQFSFVDIDDETWKYEGLVTIK